MAREKLKKQDLKLKEDEFLTFTMKAEEWLAGNYKSLLLIVVASAALAAVIISINTWRAKVIADNNATYAAVQAYAYNLPYFIGEDLAAQRQQIVSDANSKISTLMEKAGGKPLGRGALFLKATLHYEMREYDNAISTITNFLNSAVTPEERTRGQLLLGYCYESKIYDELMKPSGVDIQATVPWRNQAMDAFKAAAQTAQGTYLEYEALLCQARIYDLQMDYDQSLALLERVKNERGWFDDYSKKAANFDENIPIASFLKNFEEQQRYVTFAEVASLYEKRLEGLAGN